MSTMKLTLLTDFYELTMMQGYFKNGMNGRVVFDAFYRKNPDDGGYAVCAGLDQVIDYVKRLTFSDEDIPIICIISASPAISTRFRKERSFFRTSRWSRLWRRSWKPS